MLESVRLIQTFGEFDQFAEDFGGQKRDFIENTAGAYEEEKNIDNFQHLAFIR